uniref:Putative lipocalin n=1 Tax=Ixodes ricinus TaxID=34613 RepID=A0A6B0UWM9_IXORI
MIAALFLVIQLLGQSESQTIICDGDFPNATEVMVKLPRTYRLQSAFNVSTLDCAVQLFYNETYDTETYRKYNLVYVYTTGKYQDQPFYVKGVVNYTILLRYWPACSLLVTNETFSNPNKKCTEAFTRHCGNYAYNYTSIHHCINRNDYN